ALLADGGALHLADALQAGQVGPAQSADLLEVVEGHVIAAVGDEEGERLLAGAVGRHGDVEVALPLDAPGERRHGLVGEPAVEARQPSEGLGGVEVVAVLPSLPAEPASDAHYQD